DRDILAWARELDPAWLDEDLAWYSGAINADVVRPRTLIVMHLFNHQTHHRGQVHAMLTAAGESTGATDLAFILPDPM
ncbi:DinB family protein, partial [Staphylococcus aureus]